jgi:hypothetical protein
MPRQSKAMPPLYLLKAGETCPSCAEATNVFTLVATDYYDAEDNGTLELPLVLKNIERLPKRTLNLLLLRCPGWEFDREYPGDPPYLMNHCLRCRAKLTDHYLHDEPGSAFFPCSAEECWNISMFVLPDTATVPVVCSYTIGGMTQWLDYSKAKPLTEL